MEYVFHQIYHRITCSSDLQNVTSCRRSPILLSASRWVKTVLSSRSLINLTASFRTLSELFLALSALQNIIYMMHYVTLQRNGKYNSQGIFKIKNIKWNIPVVMAHIGRWPIGRRVSSIIGHSSCLKWNEIYIYLDTVFAVNNFDISISRYACKKK